MELLLSIPITALLLGTTKWAISQRSIYIYMAIIGLHIIAACAYAAALTLVVEHIWVALIMIYAILINLFYTTIKVVKEDRK